LNIEFNEVLTVKIDLIECYKNTKNIFENYKQKILKNDLIYEFNQFTFKLNIS